MREGIRLEFQHNCYIFPCLKCSVFPACLGGEIGRRNGLKIRRSERFMRVRFPPQAPSPSRVSSYFEVVGRVFFLHTAVCIYARNYARRLIGVVGKVQHGLKFGHRPMQSALDELSDLLEEDGLFQFSKVNPR